MKIQKKNGWGEGSGCGGGAGGQGGCERRIKVFVTKNFGRGEVGGGGGRSGWGVRVDVI